ncbi:MAG: T9SS type A sorting domain-containing protein [Candidatus Kariarchaeaceae archaeon]|jgi:hypothetical protein
MKFILYFFQLLLLCTSILHAEIINIPADIDSIQGGIDMTVDGDTVLVQPGTYVENINFNGKNIVVGSLMLTTGDTSYISQTIIEDSSGIKVTFENGEDSTAVLSGFSVNGINSYNGGGILVLNSSPTLSYLNVYNNHRGDAIPGGGIRFISSNTRISHVKVKSNRSGNPSQPGRFGGIYCWKSNLTITDVKIIENHGGIALDSSNAVLNNVEIKDNIINGGMQCYNSNPRLNNVKIYGNSNGEPWGGGEVSRGGGIYLDNSNPTLVNVEITNNIAGYHGGIYCDHSDLTLINSTISRNYQGTNEFPPYNPQANSVFCQASNLILINSISWFNDWKELAAIDTSSITFLHSDIQGGLDSILAYTDTSSTVNWLTGNINANPIFVDTANGDYNLKEGSPCIDKGIQDTMIVYNNGQDTIYIPIIAYNGNAPDMGAYESPYTVTKIGTFSKTPTKFSLSQNYPNPFNPSTTIEFTLPKPDFVTLKIYNLLGQEVATLVSDRLASGNYKYNWDASGLASGLYFYRLFTDSGYEMVKKLVLVK